MIVDALAQHRTGRLGSGTFRGHMQRTHAARSATPEHTAPSPDAIAFGESLPTIRQTTRLLIEEALQRTGNNQSQAAQLLGITQQALSKRLRNWKKRD